LLKRCFPESEYHIPLFDEIGYVRKFCPTCEEYYWTQNPDQPMCGESTAHGCAAITFINDPPTRKSYSLSEMREMFLSFFENQGHTRIKPYPVVCRWRDDLYFTSASIVDFQPYVTNGIIPPPANPLVISQPCMRFVDVDNVGPTFGRHLTIFEMGGHHAFNYPDKEVYWKDSTVRYHHEFLTKDLGIKSEEIVYKEDVWEGGGNAGPDLETIVRGLEVDTLVFMKFKVVNGEYIELPIRTVDTGYGIERFTWLSQGAPSCFHAVYTPIIDKIMQMAGVAKVNAELLRKIAQYSGKTMIEKIGCRLEARETIAKSVGLDINELLRFLNPIESVFAVADHTKSLVFMLAEGVVPSNVQEGYLTRLMIRRTYRLLHALGIEEKLLDIVDAQISLWSRDFTHLKGMREEISTMLSVESEKYIQTLNRGSQYTKRLVQYLKAKGSSQLPQEYLIQLYDSHGLTPEVVAETVDSEEIRVDIPENFYSTVAAQHVQAPPKAEEEPIEGLETELSDLPPTRMLYYEDAHMKEFQANVLKVIKQYIVLNQTTFYPEGGGQPADLGALKFNGAKIDVVNVQKVGNIIIHVVEGVVPKEGDKVTGCIDWNRRVSLMRHHTGTHVIMGAARRVLGQHIWQSGAQKEVEASRLDISHYQRLTMEEIQRIEELANDAVMRAIPVETTFMPRTEAERKYGFRLYQGGAVPGKEIRVVKTGDWEVQACGGTHVKNTSEIGFIKILRTERIQDGVERIIFSAGIQALSAVQKDEELLAKVCEKLNTSKDKLETTAERLITEWKEARRERERLIKEIVAHDAGKLAGTIKTKEIGELKMILQEFKPLDVGRMIKTANELVKRDSAMVVVFHGNDLKTARLVVMAGKKATEKGIDAREIANAAAVTLGGGGSGKPDFAQGGGTNVAKISEALQRAENTIKKQQKNELKKEKKRKREK
jgi:alanyl-tRNA synthetase